MLLDDPLFYKRLEELTIAVHDGSPLQGDVLSMCDRAQVLSVVLAISKIDQLQQARNAGANRMTTAE